MAWFLFILISSLIFIIISSIGRIFFFEYSLYIDLIMMLFVVVIIPLLCDKGVLFLRDCVPLKLRQSLDERAIVGNESFVFGLGSIKLFWERQEMGNFYVLRNVLGRKSVVFDEQVLCSLSKQERKTVISYINNLSEMRVIFPLTALYFYSLMFKAIFQFGLQLMPKKWQTSVRTIRESLLLVFFMPIFNIIQQFVESGRVQQKVINKLKANGLELSVISSVRDKIEVLGRDCEGRENLFSPLCIVDGRKWS